ncbi:amidohydrolase family protein [Caulobacter sp. S45]|jgi:predicted TIM-barrel fold metal-dependent hydrolase|uniref:amidohydrolase family protein n=1 Tax=Caulobacter sp. S45 TaxID=1641861 RepID=UPI00131D77EF|nr:amidohydrolase family protein [Caulobacter sp. S45]
MRIIALEEHFNDPSLIGRIDPDAIVRRGFPSGDTPPAAKKREAALHDLGPDRLADMDAAGISLQVLSIVGPASDLLPAGESLAWARDANDLLARSVRANPGRYAGFAHLPMTATDAVADELERAVTELGFRGALINGTTEGRFLDDPLYAPLLARAEALDVPLYLHPGLPPEAVRQAYYDHLPGKTGYFLSTTAWGWHQEVAIHVLRLVLSGALDRHRGLKIIIGHMGEGLPAMLARCDDVFSAGATPHLKRSVSQTILDQVWITISAFFTLPPLMAALLTFGTDRILFSVDYPFSSNLAARQFLDTLPLSPADRMKIAHGNAERLLKLKA